MPLRSGNLFFRAGSRIWMFFGDARACTLPLQRRLIPQTVTTSAQYASGTQYLYGVWDWDMDNWNKISPVQQAISLKAPQTVSKPVASQTPAGSSFTTPCLAAKYNEASSASAVAADTVKL